MRNVGALGMSVGTSLAFEGEGGLAVPSSDNLLLNLRTIIRNAHQAYDDIEEGYNETNVYDAVVEDLIKIGNWLNEVRGNKPIAMTVYYPSYQSLNKKFRYAGLWEPTSEKQQRYARFVDRISSKLLKEYPKLILSLDCSFPEFSGKGIVITHHPVDLTFTSGTTRLYLLESHTGTLKPYTQWYTKLTGGDDLYYMPFNHLTIQVFGDKSTNFKSSSQGIKKLVKDLAITAKWTSATSYDRVRSSINGLSMSTDKAGLQLLLK